MHNLDARRARRILLTQAAVALATVGIASVFGWAAGLSAMIGGGTALAANTLFATGVFGRYEAHSPGRLLARFYGAELLKLLFIIAAFAATFVWVKPLSVWALFSAFLVVQVLPLLLVNRVVP